MYKSIINRLNKLYAVSDTALLPEALEGYLVAVILCPKMLPPGEWIDGVFGPSEEDIPEFPDPKTGQEVMTAILEYYNLIVKGIEQNCYEVPKDEDEDDPQLQIQEWSLGFANGLLRHLEDWEPIIDSGDIRFLWPLALFYSVFPQGFLSDPELKKDAKELEAYARTLPEHLPSLIYELYEYNKESLSADTSPTRPQKRGPRIGRNDPCPCGSGKKYKHCCGKN
jgi:uncharacterized protein